MRGVKYVIWKNAGDLGRAVRVAQCFEIDNPTGRIGLRDCAIYVSKTPNGDLVPGSNLYVYRTPKGDVVVRGE